MHDEKSPQNNNSIKVSVAFADPSAIGLFGLAIVTLVASSNKLGITDGVSLIIPWAIFLGAAAQIYASVADGKLKNTFGATAFGAYGFFWLGMAMTWMIQNGVFGETLQNSADKHQLGFAFIGYLIFTLIMTYGAAGIHKILFFIFVFIDILFAGLAVNALTGSEAAGLTAGVAELIISLLAFYGCGAAVLNAHFGKIILPTGKAFIKR